MDYHEGIPLGIYNKDKHEMVIYNHLEFTILNHKIGDSYRIVGLEVEPYSFGPGADRHLMPETQKAMNRIPQILVPGQDIEFSYDIKIKESSVAWDHRMDHYNKISSHYEQVYHM